MLEEAHALRERGVDVVLGFVETPRPAGDRRAGGGPGGDSRGEASSTAGVTVEEMDLDAVLARKPEVAIVDEIAHTNAPGSRNRKR